MADLVPLGDPNNRPKAAPYKTGRQRYRWAEMRPDDWFEFSKNVKPGSARVMASQAGNAYAFQFHVYATEDGRLICHRIDGLPIEEKWTPVPRDDFGNVILPEAKINAGGAPKPAGSGRVYGDGANNGAPMPGENFHQGDVTIRGDDYADDI